MISRTAVNALRPTLQRRAQAVASHAVPKAAAEASKLTAERMSKQIAERVAPPESLWYRFKKEVINVISNLNYNMKDVHKVTAEMAEKVQPRLKAGDILLRRTEGTSGNWFIPSWWKHAGVYTGNGEIVEATFKGIQKNSFKEFMTHGDDVMIVRAKNLSAEQRRSIATYANHQVGKPYDFDFNFVDDARQSCTELANHAVTAGAGKELIQKNWIGSVTGDAFKNENFKLVWTSNKQRAHWG